MTRTPRSSRRLLSTLAAVGVLAAGLAAAPPVLAQRPPGVAPGAGAAAPTPTPRAEGPAVSQLFHITLVAASKTPGGGAAEALPKGVAKALDDLRDFLPYKSYRVVDGVLVRASEEAYARLTGPGGAEYQVQMQFRPEVPGAAGSPASAYVIDRFQMREEPSPAALEKAGGSKGPAVAPMAPESNLTASFRIARGETVVVGSSRLDGGDEAMIVLLTAVP